LLLCHINWTVFFGRPGLRRKGFPPAAGLQRPRFLGQVLPLKTVIFSTLLDLPYINGGN